MLRVLKERFRGLDQQVKGIFPYHEILLQLQSRIEKSAPVRWFVEYKDHIASCLYLLWIIGCIYWLYQLVIYDARPAMVRLISVDDPRDAVVFIFFGTFGLIYLAFFVAFFVKFILNIIRGGIQSLFSLQWYSLVKSITLLVFLNFAFLYIEPIKVAGLTAYTQVAELVHISSRHSAVIETDNTIDVSRMLELLGKQAED